MTNPTSRSWSLSFEFFPPKVKEKEEVLWATVSRLSRFRPDFVSLTYGAGGSDRDRTAQLILQMQERAQTKTVAHLTCIGDRVAELKHILDFYQASGLRHILALRGDQPRNADPAALTRGDFKHSAEFVAFIRNNYPDFRIGVAAYPETHPEAASSTEGLLFFKSKVTAGADFAVTQFFFENDVYFQFVDACRTHGVTIPILPGIMPVTDFKQITRLAELCGSDLPEWLTQRFEPIKNDKDLMYQTGLQLGLSQCQDLLARGAPGLHFFTLNQSNAVSDILEGLNLG